MYIGCRQCVVKTQTDGEGILCSLDHFCFLCKRDSKEHWVGIETAQSQQSDSKNSPQTRLTGQKLVRTLHRNNFLLKQDLKTGRSSYYVNGRASAKVTALFLSFILIFNLFPKFSWSKPPGFLQSTVFIT